MAPSFHSKPHALAVPLPFQGHITPLLDLSKKLVSAGFMVTFANTHTNHERLTTSQLELDKEGGEGGVEFMSLGEEVHVERASGFETLIEVLKPAMRGAVERLLAELNKKEPPVSLLVFDFRLVFVLDLAIAAGIPSISLWTQNAASFVCNALVSRGFQPPSDESTLFTCAQGVPPLKRKEITNILIASLPPPFPSDEYAWSPFRRVSEPTWIVINTFEELEGTTLDKVEETLGLRPLALGPLVNAPSFTVSKGLGMKSFQSDLKTWLQGHPKDSVLYIAFGTLAGLSEMQLEELVLGVKASKQPFIWVFRTNLCVQSKYTLESLSKTLGNQGILVPWAPQRDVLSHPSVGGFLTHCGWNSNIEGITAGVPMLAWPIFVDQFLNKRCVVEQWGIGLGFDAVDGTSGLVTRMEVEEKIKTMMQGRRGKEMREKANSLSNLAKRAYEEGGSSCINFDRIKEQLRSFQQKV